MTHFHYYLLVFNTPDQSFFEIVYFYLKYFKRCSHEYYIKYANPRVSLSDFVSTRLFFVNFAVFTSNEESINTTIFVSDHKIKLTICTIYINETLLNLYNTYCVYFELRYFLIFLKHFIHSFLFLSRTISR